MAPLINVHPRIVLELKIAACLIAKRYLATGRIWENALAVDQTKTAGQVNNFRSDHVLTEPLTNALKKIEIMQSLAIYAIA